MAPASTVALQGLKGKTHRRASDTRKALDVAREALAQARARLEANVNHDDTTAIALTLEVVEDQLDAIERHLAEMVLEMQQSRVNSQEELARTKTRRAGASDPFESKEKYALVVALLTTSLIATLFALVYKSTQK